MGFRILQEGKRGFLRAADADDGTPPPRLHLWGSCTAGEQIGGPLRPGEHPKLQAEDPEFRSSLSPLWGCCPGTGPSRPLPLRSSFQGGLRAPVHGAGDVGEGA